jgi:hypothetical protein
MTGARWARFVSLMQRRSRKSFVHAGILDDEKTS